MLEPAVATVAAAEPMPARARPASALPLPEPAVATEIAEPAIVWWRGYVRSQFLAVVSDGAGGIALFAESPAFRWRGREAPPRAGEAEVAHAELLQKLETLGWSVRPRSGEQHDGAWWEAELTHGEAATSVPVA